MSGRKKVFVSRILPPDGMAELEKHKELDIEVWQEKLPPPRNVLLEKVKGCDGVISLLTDPMDGEVMDAAGPQLKVISNFAVGYNNIDTTAAKDRGIHVGNTPGVLTEATADMAASLIFAAARRIPEAQNYAREGKWKTWEPMGHVGMDLVDKTLGIVGMGRIGYSLAKKLSRGWDMKVIYYDAIRSERAEIDLNARRCESLEECLRESDIISVHALLLPETKHMFNTKEFQMMKPTCIFINCARGPIVYQPAMIEACRNHTIFAAGVDVTDPEPAAADDPVLSLPNLIVVPHIASATFKTRNAMAMICVRNLLAGLEGRGLQEEVPETKS